MDILKIDPDYDCADTDTSFESLPKDEQDDTLRRYAEAQEINKQKAKKPDQQEDTK